jgi:putative transposase
MEVFTTGDFTKKSRFTESQIVAILKEAESGLAVAEILRSHGISGATLQMAL